ncbi:MAG: ABC transporter permease [Alphaproteobacteria bacterium]|nr:ABC transporter permease [Alphaproteobacteria bacterium]
MQLNAKFEKLSRQEINRWIVTTVHFSLQEIKLRYRGSFMGPMWIVLNTLIQIITICVIYPKVFSVDRGEYVKWIACGIIPWQFIALSITESCTTYVASRGIYSSQSIPMSFFAYKQVLTNVFIFLHQIPTYLLIAFLFDIPITIVSFLNLMFGLVIIAYIMYHITLILGVFAARFSDVSQIIANMMNLAFLLTPIIWIPKLVSGSHYMTMFNPLFYFIDVLRTPLLGENVAYQTWGVLFAMALIITPIARKIFSSYRQQIIFWG